MADKKRPQDGPHKILKNIRYHGQGPHAEQIVTPKDGVTLTFEHLTDSGYQLLLATRTIAPVEAPKPKGA